MICCSGCFNDIELKPIIEGLGKRGKCSNCGCADSYIYDTDIDSSLAIYFDELINIYTPVGLLPVDYPKAELILLKDELSNNWNIFNNLTTNQVYYLITNISKDKYTDSPELFDSPVGIAEFHDPDYLKTHSLLKANRWEDFVNAVKTENRFHANFINTEILDIFCSYIRKSYKKGMVFYRGRISPPTGLDCNVMGAPPSNLATAGRANAMGIRCLYLANDIETTIHEVRAGAHDYVSIGTFELLEDIIVVDLKSIDKISPFVGLNSTQHAINKEHLKKINNEMAKTLRRSDSPLDYVPTQYISDFIKSIEHGGKSEYAGLEYNSTMNREGFNLAVFNPDLFRCTCVDTYKIKELKYFKEIVK